MWPKNYSCVRKKINHPSPLNHKKKFIKLYEIWFRHWKLITQTVYFRRISFFLSCFQQNLYFCSLKNKIKRDIKIKLDYKTWKSCMLEKLGADWLNEISMQGSNGDLFSPLFFRHRKRSNISFGFFIVAVVSASCFSIFVVKFCSKFLPLQNKNKNFVYLYGTLQTKIHSIINRVHRIQHTTHELKHHWEKKLYVDRINEPTEWKNIFYENTRELTCAEKNDTEIQTNKTHTGKKTRFLPALHKRNEMKQEKITKIIT